MIQTLRPAMFGYGQLHLTVLRCGQNVFSQFMARISTNFSERSDAKAQTWAREP